MARASMRPPQNAGENTCLRSGLRPPCRASMRPPQNAGENQEASDALAAVGAKLQ